MISRRVFLLGVLASPFFVSCSPSIYSKFPGLKRSAIDVIKTSLEPFDVKTPEALQRSILEYKPEENLRFFGDRALRVLTFGMLAPRNLTNGTDLNGDQYLLSYKDYKDTPLKNLVDYARTTYKINKDFLEEKFIIVDDDKMIDNHGREGGVYVSKKELQGVMDEFCRNSLPEHGPERESLASVFDLMALADDHIGYDDIENICSQYENLEKSECINMLVFLTAAHKFRAVAKELLLIPIECREGGLRKN